MCGISHFWKNLFLSHFHRKKSYSTMRAKRAISTFWVDKMSFKKRPKIVNFGEYLKPLNFRSNSVTKHVTKDKNWWKMPKLKYATFWLIFKHCDFQWFSFSQFLNFVFYALQSIKIHFFSKMRVVLECVFYLYQYAERGAIKSSIKFNYRLAISLSTTK